MIPGESGANMRYPHEFVERVRAEYPETPDVVAAAEGGKFGLGVLLARGASMTMSHEDIVVSIDSGECRQVRDDAAQAVRRRLLHAEWMRTVLKNISEARDPSSSPSLPPPSARRRPFSSIPASA